jgi:hypothetical protein
MEQELHPRNKSLQHREQERTNFIYLRNKNVGSEEKISYTQGTINCVQEKHSSTE